MIATILLGMVILFFIIVMMMVIIGQLKFEKTFPIDVFFGFLLVVVFLVGGIILCLYNPNNYEELKIQKQDLIENYKDCPCEHHLKSIKNHNTQVNKKNNYFYSFKLEDRSEYLIDIDKLLKGELE